MRLYLCLCLAITLAVFETPANADIQIMRLDPDPDYPNQCYNPNTGEARQIGEQWADSRMCTKNSCSYNEEVDKYDITIAGCSETHIKDSSCTLVPGEGQFYPDCCPIYQCE